MAFYDYLIRCAYLLSYVMYNTESTVEKDFLNITLHVIIFVCHLIYSWNLGLLNNTESLYNISMNFKWFHYNGMSYNTVLCNAWHANNKPSLKKSDYQLINHTPSHLMVELWYFYFFGVK